MIKNFGKVLLFCMLLFAAASSEAQSNNQDLTKTSPGSEEKVLENQLKNAGPDEILIAFIKSELKTDIKKEPRKYYSLLSNKDKEAVKEERFLRHSLCTIMDYNIHPYFQITSPSAVSGIMKKFSCRITGSIIENDVAKLELEISKPEDFEDKIYSPGSEKELLSYLNSPDLKFEKSVISCKLLKEADGWRVFLDVETKNKIESLATHVQKLKPEGVERGNVSESVLKKLKSDLILAKEKHKEVLTLLDEYEGWDRADLTLTILFKIEFVINRMQSLIRFG